MNATQPECLVRFEVTLTCVCQYYLYSVARMGLLTEVSSIVNQRCCYKHYVGLVPVFACGNVSYDVCTEYVRVMR